MSKKPIIVFEGIEGSGKSYHLTSVARYLKQKKISFIKIREPGGSQNSEKIRRLMLNNKSNFNKLKHHTYLVGVLYYKCCELTHYHLVGLYFLF